MAVITADGVVGKVLRAFGSTSQVLLIDDQTSGVGAILEKSRLQGILRGTPSGEVVLEKVMSDEQVQAGERVLSSGGDLVFPKGMPVGTVSGVSKGAESFLDIHVKPSANLAKLEEVLVITKKEEKEPTVAEGTPVRAIDILTQRLPSVPQQAAMDPNAPPPPTSGLVIAPATGAKPQASGMATSKPQTQNGALVEGQNPVANSAKPQSNANATANRDVFSPPEAKSPAASAQKLSEIPGVAPDTTKRVVGNSPAAKPKIQPVTPPPATQPPPAEDRPH
jgi:rod shape-determining protein MreC